MKLADRNAFSEMSNSAISTREAGKEKRRQRILDEARTIIALEGYDSLNARDLAKSANVTVPTLYNLVGNKEEILTRLTLEAMAQLEAEMQRIELGDPLAYFDELIIKSTALIEADPGFFRGSLLAMYQLSASHAANSPEEIFDKRGTDVVTRGCQMATEENLLIGNIVPEALGKQIYKLYTAHLREWVYQRLSLEEFRYWAKLAFFTCLCADASTEFLKTLRKSIEAHHHKNE